MLVFQGKHVDFFVGNILFTRSKIYEKVYMIYRNYWIIYYYFYLYVWGFIKNGIIYVSSDIPS